MSIQDTGPPIEGDLGPCKWTIPPAEDSPRGAKSTICGAQAVAVVRIREKLSRRVVITDAKVELCAEHKAIHDERAASFRTGK